MIVLITKIYIFLCYIAPIFKDVDNTWAQNESGWFISTFNVNQQSLDAERKDE